MDDAIQKSVLSSFSNKFDSCFYEIGLWKILGILIEVSYYSGIILK